MASFFVLNLVELWLHKCLPVAN